MGAVIGLSAIRKVIRRLSRMGYSDLKIFFEYFFSAFICLIFKSVAQTSDSAFTGVALSGQGPAAAVAKIISGGVTRASDGPNYT
ncbi:hypothetical protein [Pseudomonas viridiflava]|uniref:hypothetical protein n=1 Tax=Pseudomonas viridiflava TaxID=33069 RepID=UPI000F0503D3|nr:hypothetical protein [Pseudomonas viridiflava]MEE4142910.1 hypothetical protein [Pseudomonas viridiflava]MEE4158600.1 hypothetical protein [Pseudomonas viridiflava]